MSTSCVYSKCSQRRNQATNFIFLEYNIVVTLEDSCWNFLLPFGEASTKIYRSNEAGNILNQYIIAFLRQINASFRHWIVSKTNKSKEEHFQLLYLILLVPTLMGNLDTGRETHQLALDLINWCTV